MNFATYFYTAVVVVIMMLVIACSHVASVEAAAPQRFVHVSQDMRASVMRDSSSGLCWGVHHYHKSVFGPIPCE